MSDNHKLSVVSSKASSKADVCKKEKQYPEKKKQKQVNWHEAVSCAIQIDLKEYRDFLEYKSEYILGKNSYRIDLLVIKKLTLAVIPRKIAAVFKMFNLFEIKGIGSSAAVNSYYKTIGYAGLFINQINTGQHTPRNDISAADISLTLLSCHYPRKLIHHLRKERKIEVAKYAPGVYHISQRPSRHSLNIHASMAIFLIARGNKETFTAQIIVTKELTVEENLYLRCLTDGLKNMPLTGRLIDDYRRHETQPVYNRYMRQLTAAYVKKKGVESMVENEWIFELCGTSSDEIIERTRQEDADYYLPKIDKLSTDNNNLSAHIKDLFSQNNYLKSLLEQHHIPFNPDFKPQSGQ